MGVLKYYKELTHFGLTVLAHFGTKNQTKFIPIFEKYQVFVHNFLWQNIPILPNCILLTRTKSKNWLYFFFLIF